MTEVNDVAVADDDSARAVRAQARAKAEAMYEASRRMEERFGVLLTKTDRLRRRDRVRYVAQTALAMATVLIVSAWLVSSTWNAAVAQFGGKPIGFWLAAGALLSARTARVMVWGNLEVGKKRPKP